jgi:hypothetical protein
LVSQRSVKNSSTTEYTELLSRSQAVKLYRSIHATRCAAAQQYSFSLFIFFALRPPLGGIDDGTGGFAQDPPMRVLLGNDGGSGFAMAWGSCDRQIIQPGIEGG